jgi:hypothetical protein
MLVLAINAGDEVATRNQVEIIRREASAALTALANVRNEIHLWPTDLEVAQ